jgi:hypothetical protein
VPKKYREMPIRKLTRRPFLSIILFAGKLNKMKITKLRLIEAETLPGDTLYMTVILC